MGRELRPLDLPAVDAKQLQRWLKPELGDETWRGALEVRGVGRVRVSVFRQLGEPAAVLELLPERPPPLPPEAAPLSSLERGLIIVAGRAGSGRTTAAASLTRDWKRRALRLEHPAEFAKPQGTPSQLAKCALASRVKKLKLDLGDPEPALLVKLARPDRLLVATLLARDGHEVVQALRAGGASTRWLRARLAGIWLLTRRRGQPPSSQVFTGARLMALLD